MSLGARILDRFSLFLEFLPYPSPSEKPPNILEKRHYVEHATRALQLLAEHEFATTNAAAIKSGRKGARQKGKKSVDNAIYKNAIDPKVFDALGIPVPTDKDGTSAVVKNIIDEQKRCMEVSTDFHGIVAIDNMIVVLSTRLTPYSPTRHHTECLHLWR